MLQCRAAPLTVNKKKSEKRFSHKRHNSASFKNLEKRLRSDKKYRKKMLVDLHGTKWVCNLNKREQYSTTKEVSNSTPWISDTSSGREFFSNNSPLKGEHAPAQSSGISRRGCRKRPSVLRPLRPDHVLPAAGQRSVASRAGLHNAFATK
ncbi:hypothetical protein GN956_G21709 [Arapaima gigas]